jgi:hypothetical protein
MCCMEYHPSRHLIGSSPVSRCAAVLDRQSWGTSAMWCISGTCQLGIDPSHPSPRRCPQYHTQASSLFRPGTFSLVNPLCSKPDDGEASNYFSGKSLFKLRVVTLLFLGGWMGRWPSQAIPKVAMTSEPNDSSREYDQWIHCALRKLFSSIPGVLQPWLAVS